jgi:uncharacterized protein (TIGR00255 family)
MLLSMTGFGHSIFVFENKQISIDIKCLNSKSLDLFARMPNLYRELEFEMREYISKNISRGKIDFSINAEWLDTQPVSTINKTAFTDYYHQLKSLKEEINLPEYEPDWFSVIFRLPEVVNATQKQLGDEEKKAIMANLALTVSQVLEFRKKEGAVLENELIKHVENIENKIKEIEVFEKKRIEILKQRLQKDMEDFMQNLQLDKNRFEQELIYYLEKLDITEEKVRLHQHCQYFFDTCKSGEYVGRKLSFIGQEMGREINTLGSKAQDSSIQKIVVEMKDELEKVKEQVLNII